jgi:hypothetical protein
LPFVLPSQSYSFELVERALDRGAQVVILRSWKRWIEAVPLLRKSDNVLVLRTPRSPYLTPKTLGDDGFERLVRALAN